MLQQFNRVGTIDRANPLGVRRSRDAFAQRLSRGHSFLDRLTRHPVVQVARSHTKDPRIDYRTGCVNDDTLGLACLAGEASASALLTSIRRVSLCFISADVG